MKQIIYYLLVLAGGLFFNSCTKDTDVFIPDAGQISGPSDIWYATVSTDMPINSLKKALSFASDKDSFDITNSNSIVDFASGLECTFPGNAFIDNSGTPVTGKVAVEAYLLTKKGDMIRMAKPTVSDQKMLISGGSVFIQGTKDGADLKLGYGKKIKLHFENSYPSSSMKLFSGDESSTQQFNWVECTDTLYGNNKVIPFSDGYDIYTNRLSWLNCNYFYDFDNSDAVKVSLTVPVNFTNVNTISYLVFNDEISVIEMTADATSKKFISGTVPEGKSVKVVTITKEGNFYYLGQNNFVTNKPSGNDYQNININPTKVSLDEIKNFLNNL